jgi:anti-sigma regulatory factor (Ser/Thr protein kinase)
VPRNVALRHNAFVYETRDEYVSVAVNFLQEGLELGEGAVVANTRDGIGTLRDALGHQAARVTFVDVSEAYTRPAKALAAYHRVYADELRRVERLRAVADVQFGPDPGEWDLWTGYEAVFNRSFAHLPAWVLCSYNRAVLPDPVLDGVLRTHPEVVSQGTWRDSTVYDDRDEPLRSRAKPGQLEDVHVLALGGDVGNDVGALRERIARSLQQLGLADHKVIDLLLAMTEILSNSFTHGTGLKLIRTGRIEGRYAGEIVDNGPGFDDPTAGYLAPRSGQGSGLWIARQLTWDIEFFRGPDGFTTRVTL